MEFVKFVKFVVEKQMGNFNYIVKSVVYLTTVLRPPTM